MEKQFQGWRKAAPIFLLVTVVTLPLSSSVFAAPDQTTDPGPTAQLTEFDNGLCLLVLPQPDEPLVKVDVYVSLRGAARNGGLAHLVEHLMFRSSENCPAGSLRDSLRLLSVYHNASTSPRNIHAQTRCLPGFLPRLLAVEAERFGRLRPDEADLEHERNRVLGEYDYRHEVYTLSDLDLRIIAMAYEEEGVGDPLLGSPEAIRSIGMTQVDTFLNQWVRPDRMVVLVSGPVPAAEVVAAVAATFGDIPTAGPEPDLPPLPQRPEPRHFVTPSDEKFDLLAVGFRLPYRSSEDAAAVHLTEKIMDRENGHPVLYIFDDEALLIIHTAGSWSDNFPAESAAQQAIDDFWEETGTVKRRVRDNWVFERNRTAHVEEFRKRAGKPYRHAEWRAQRLADDRDLPDPGVMAAMVDTLDQEVIRKFFAEQFTSERAFTAFAAGTTSDDDYQSSWSRGVRLKANPYLVDHAIPSELGVKDITPVLEEAAALGVDRVEATVLPNGIPLHVLKTPGAEKVFIGGVRTFPCLENDVLEDRPGRLWFYRWLANQGYDTKGSHIEPRGKRPGWDTRISVQANSLMITAHGPADRFEDVTAAMHKRIDVGQFNPFAFRWFADGKSPWVAQRNVFPTVKARLWQLREVFGPDHPMAIWLDLDPESLGDWSLKQANKLHWILGKTGNFQIVATGDIDLEAISADLAANFGQRREAEPGIYPLTKGENPGVSGAVVHHDSSTVARVEFMFPPEPLEGNPDLGLMDLFVLGNLFESRLQTAVKSAALDWVDVYVDLQAAGPAALPVVRVTSGPQEAGQILELVQEEMTRLVSVPPSADEEARARLQLVGPVVEGMLDSKESRDILLEYLQFGQAPGEPLKELFPRHFGVATRRAADLFPADHHVWTVVGDTTLAVIRNLGPIVH